MKVAFRSMSVMNDEQVAVIFELKPLSKGDGNALMLTVTVAVEMPAADVVVGVGVGEVWSRRGRSSVAGMPESNGLCGRGD